MTIDAPPGHRAPLRRSERRSPASATLDPLMRTERQVTWVRWIGIGIAVASGPFILHGGQLVALLAVCALAACYNLAFVAFIIPYRPRWLRQGYLTTIGDIALADGVIALTGGLSSELYPVYFLIAVLAAVRFGRGTGLLATAAIMASYGVLILRHDLSAQSVGETLLRLGFVGATVVFVGFVADRARAAEAAVQAAYDETLAALSSALDHRDSETEGHSQRVARCALVLGQALHLGDAALANLRRGALLHDIGKIGVSDAILRKARDLTPEEREVVRSHPVNGAHILSGIPFLADALPIVLHHHERYDGTGYPKGQRGEEIDLLARIFSVVDAYDAMVSDRPYRRGMSHDDAMAELRRNAGTQFDAQVVEAFAALPPQTWDPTLHA